MTDAAINLPQPQQQPQQPQHSRPSVVSASLEVLAFRPPVPRDEVFRAPTCPARRCVPLVDAGPPRSSDVSRSSRSFPARCPRSAGRGRALMPAPLALPVRSACSSQSLSCSPSRPRPQSRPSIFRTGEVNIGFLPLYPHSQ